MAKVTSIPDWQRALIALSGTVIAVTIVLALYWAQMVFLPLALAIFFAFLLNPLVRLLQHRGLGRVPAVGVVVLWTALLVGSLGWLLTRQVTSLANQLPQYTSNIATKIKSLQQQSGTLGRLWNMVGDVEKELKAKPGTEGTPSEEPAPDRPPLVVQQTMPGWMGRLPTFVGSAAELLGSTALTLVLTVFMLLNREDLRGRFLRLMGHGRMSFTTKAVDDAAQRVSRYLLMQAMINTGFGVCIAIGLWAIGVDYFLLWGLIAGVMRYIPYLGTWIAALFPLTLSLAVSTAWWPPIAVFVLFLTLELTSANVFEPWLFGQSIGVSGVAQLMSAAFWAFLWGPLGLVLSAPLTVVLLVVGKYVPQLAFLDVILGDEPALAPDVTFYQRLLARDQDEAAQLALATAKAGPPEQVYDDLMVPGLTFLRRDREHDDLSKADETFFLQEMREVLEDLGEQREASADTPAADKPLVTAQRRVHVLACPAHDEVDQMALEMLTHLLDPGRWVVEVATADTLTAELVTKVVDQGPALICIGALPPGGLAHTRYLCKRLRARFPDVKIIVGRWGLKEDIEANREQFIAAGADLMTTSLVETRNQLNGWLPVLIREPVQTAAG